MTTIHEPEIIDPFTKTDEVLIKAAEILQRDGWGSGALCNSEGRKCSLGAILAARGYSDDEIAYGGGMDGYARLEDDESMTRLARTIRPIFAKKFRGAADDADDISVVYAWNDSIAKTPDEVVEVFLKAAVN